MTIRLEVEKVELAASQAMMRLECYIRTSGLDKTFIELIKARASQIRCCAFCFDMHTKDTRHQTRG